MTQQPKSKEKILSIADKSNPYTIPAFRSGFNEGFISGWEAYSEQHRGCGRWVKAKPKLTEECILLTATKMPTHWDHRLWEILKVEGDDGWYFGIHSDGEEWGDYADLVADLYMIMPINHNEQSPCECQQLREAAEELLHLHSCEQEGLQSGKPTPEMWFNAVNKLSEALSDAGNKEE